MGRMRRKKNVMSRVAMCAPSTSASVMIMILWYASLERLASLGSSSVSMVTRMARNRFGDFLIVEYLVVHGFFYVEDLSSQWQYCLELAVASCFAVPPAESPSTMNSSQSSAVREEQSASFPGESASVKG